MEAGIRSITVHCCAKEENFDNLCLESSKPAVENHEYGPQDSNNVETKVKPSSVHRETVAFTMRVEPGLLEKQQRQQRRQQQSHVNTSENKVKLQKRKESFEQTRLGLQFLDDRRAEHIPSRLIFKYVYFDTMTDVTVKKREQSIGMLYFQC